MEMLVIFINIFVMVFNIILIARILMSWVQPNPQGGVGGLLVELTEPLLAPVRKLIPPAGGLDLAPLAVFLILQIVQIVANGLLPR